MTATLPPLPEELSAKLRHAYALLKAGHCGDQATFADGLIAPVIRGLEAIAAQAQPAPIVVQPESIQSFADRVKNGIADHLSDNAPMRCYDLAEIDELIRSVEIRADMLAATPPTVQPVQPTPLTDAQIEVLWGDFMSAAGSGHVPDFVRAIEAVHGIGAPAIDQTTGGVL